MAMSGGFSFDFLPPETTEGSAELPGVEHESTAKQSQQERRPFAWISNLPELLAERAEQEIVYHDVSIRGGSTAAEQHQRNAAVTAMASIEEDEEEGGEATTTTLDPIDRFALRRVDWETCSFLQATTTPLANDDDDDSDKDSSNVTKSATSSNKQEQKQIWERTDIDPGKYEGGMKIWECSLDLVRYLAQQQAQQLEDNNNGSGGNDGNGNSHNIVGSPWNVSTTGGYVLELGCGHGLPACHLLRQALEQQQQQQQEPAGNDGMTSDSTSIGVDAVAGTDHGKTTKKPWTIVFTDYNDFVVQDVTVSNIVINAEAVNVAITDLVPHVVMGAGDWLDLSRQLQLQSSSSSSSNTATVTDQQVLSESSPIAEQSRLPPDGRFDWILAAETIYSEQAAKETALFIVRHLKHTTGVALIATKRYYFGVGGGSDAFREAVHAAAEQEQQQQHEHGNGVDSIPVQVKVETVRVHDNGTGNIREILSVQVLPPAKC